MRLDTFASAADPERSTTASPSSAHTYRLLIFKELSLRSSAFFASVIKREANYAMPSEGRQPYSRKKFVGTSKSTLVTLAALMKLSVARYILTQMARGKEHRRSVRDASRRKRHHEHALHAPLMYLKDVSQRGPCLVVTAPLHIGASREAEQRRGSRHSG